jgi:hypothetical protein
MGYERIHNNKKKRKLTPLIAQQKHKIERMDMVSKNLRKTRTQQQCMHTERYPFLYIIFFLWSVSKTFVYPCIVYLCVQYTVTCLQKFDVFCFGRQHQKYH